MDITARTPTRHTRTAIAGVAAGALTCMTLGLSGGTATAEDTGRVDIGSAKHGGIEAPPPMDVGFAKHGGIGAPEPVDLRRLLNDIDTPVGAEEDAPATSDAPIAVLVDGGSLECGE